MNKYRVIIGFSGAIGYDVKAGTPEEAEDKARELFEDETGDAVRNCITESETVECMLKGDRNASARGNA